MICAAPAGADGYADHEGVKIFSDYPCGRVIDAIDAEFVFDELSEVLGRKEAMSEMVGYLARQGMAWGFILGFDTAKGGLHADGQTTLERLRIACTATPDKTAMDLLENFD